MTNATIPLPLAASFTSREPVLGPGEETYFCEIACHLACRAVGVSRAGLRTAVGRARWQVTVVTRFDPEITAPWRPAGRALVPGPRRARLRLADGTAVRAVAESESGGLGILDEDTPLSEPLRPGESPRSVLFFFPPARASLSGPLLEDDPGLSPLWICHQRSPLHAKVLPALPESGSAG